LEEFSSWLESKGHNLLLTKGEYEVLGWKGQQKGEAMPIIFDRLAGDHFTTNSSATKYAVRFYRERNKK